jgi:hypothetical protein
LQNNAFNRSYPFSYDISAANTWEYKTVTISGDTTGTWVGSTNGIGLRLNFSLGTGSSSSGTAGAWAGSAFVSSTGATSVVGTNGATFYITGVQLEAGSVATPFERRSYGQELALCQRYYEQSDATQIWSGKTTAGQTYARLQVYYKVTKRAVPSVITITNVNCNAFPSTTPSTDASGIGSVQLNLLANATSDDGYINMTWQASAEL